MRKIIFKGKRADNGQWVYGLPYACHYGLEVDGIETADGERHPIVPETAAEYTGINDFFGSRIFEGDIVKAKHNSGSSVFGVVVFENGTFKLEPYGREVDGEFSFIADLTHNLVPHTCFAIENNFMLRCYTLYLFGNIHDNPELLEGNHA